MSKPTIILLEPDEVLGTNYQQALETRGYEVMHVHTAQDAIIAADSQRPNLVICELQLISHSGIEFLYEFRSYSDWQNIPVMVLSIVPPIEFKNSRNGLEEQLGIQAYLYKPKTSLTQLIRTAEELIGS